MWGRVRKIGIAKPALPPEELYNALVRCGCHSRVCVCVLSTQGIYGIAAVELKT